MNMRSHEKVDWHDRKPGEGRRQKKDQKPFFPELGDRGKGERSTLYQTL